MLIRRVQGNSMSPALKPGDIVIGWNRDTRVGDVVVAQAGGREVIKRIERLDDDTVYLVGDNRQESTDSRHYGSLPRRAILGTIMIHFARATKPATPRTPYANRLGLALAVVFLVMVLLHLVRIDKFIPIIAGVLPGGTHYVTLFVASLVTAEVFALPFLLGLTMSPLARIFSGAFVVLVPLVWTGLSIWVVGKPMPLGEFSSYIHMSSNAAIVLLNLAWLGVSYAALWALSYDKSFTQLNKRH